MSEIKNGYVTVEDVINDNSFRIPTYQRGYRWGKENVQKLLEDIYENKTIENSENSDDFEWNHAIYELRNKVFNINKNIINDAKNPYCIQPLVVCKNDNSEKYDVIDGQQRLTTIAISICALKQACNNKDFKLPGVNLSYESRPNSADFISCLGEESTEKANQNIDFMYINQAYETAKTFFENELKKPDGENKTTYARLLRNILLKNTQFIWYRINSKDMDPHEVFANFNTGKIELTNAELVKALFMDTANYDEYESIEDKRIVISEKWDEIENALHNPDFWAFVPHNDQYGDGGYDTRIDVIFEMFIMRYYVVSKGWSFDKYRKYRNEKNRDRYIFDEIDTWIKEQLSNGKEEHKSKHKIMQDCWYEIRKIYLGLLELYEIDTIGNYSNKLYNMAGLYINFKNRSNGKVDAYKKDPFLFLEVYNDLANVLQKPRSSRMSELQQLIMRELGIEKNEIEGFIKKIRYSNSDEKGVIKDPEIIVKVLLAYNIGLLNKSEGIGQRFNFKEFANLKWEREHIFASNVDEAKNKAYNLNEENERKAALRILAEDIEIDKDTKRCKNSYVEYIRNVYFFGKPFPPEYNGKELIFSEQDLMDRYLKSDSSNSEDTSKKMLIKAIKTYQECKKFLSYYDIIDRIKLAKTYDNDEERKKQIFYHIINDLGKELYTSEYVNINKHTEEALEQYPNLENNEVKIGNHFHHRIWDTQKEKKEWIKLIHDSFRDYVRGLYMKNPTKSDKSDDFIVKNFEEIDWNKMFEVFDFCRDTLLKSIDSFFEKNSAENDFTENDSAENGSTVNASKEKLSFAKLLADNTMGNMTLLTGNKSNNSQTQTSQNQQVSNKSFKLKKQLIHEFFQSGDFVPLGTLLVFSDIYNDSENVANFWLPDSRQRYLDDIIATLNAFLGSN